MEDEPARWYCIKTKPRQEITARRWLQTDLELDVFCPLIRFERARRSGKVRVTEAMFPGYVFARFIYTPLYRRVATSNGVATIVAFGGLPATVPDPVIDELRASVSSGETIEIPSRIEAGDEVDVIAGPFVGVKAVVTRVLPARQRVAVLMEILGMEREIEVDQAAVIAPRPHPLAAG